MNVFTFFVCHMRRIPHYFLLYPNCFLEHKPPKIIEKSLLAHWPVSLELGDKRIGLYMWGALYPGCYGTILVLYILINYGDDSQDTSIEMESSGSPAAVLDESLLDDSLFDESLREENETSPSDYSQEESSQEARAFSEEEENHTKNAVRSVK